ncbi:MAG: hypothetical protein GXO39_01810 [Thermotogae bacterium]|nr:hypothetical protein [Thermotogota bacterium]
MKTLALVNPVSRSGERVFRKFYPFLKERFSLDVIFTRWRGHASEIAAGTKAELLFIFGGDGTLNETVNGLVKNTHFPLVAPTFGGSGCDVARSLGIEKDPKKRVEEVLRSITSRKYRRIFLSRVDTDKGGRFFIGVSDVGFGASVARNFDRWRRWGRFGYAIAVAEVLKGYEGTEITFRLDDNSYTFRAMMLIFARTPFFGGGMKISPNSDPTSREARVLLLREVGKLRFLLNFPRVYFGNHLHMPEIVELKGKSLYVETAGLPVEAEGEFVGHTPALYMITETYINFV